MATAHPDMILSLTWVSPLPSTEPEDIAAGRQEVWQCWLQAFDHSGDSLSEPTVPRDKDMLDDVIRGAQELCFNNQSSSLTEAITRCATLQASHLRAGTPERLVDSHATSIGWFINRRPLSRRALSKVKLPSPTLMVRINVTHEADNMSYSTNSLL